MLDGDKLLALAVGAFSGVWPSAIDYDDAPMPDVAPPDPMPEPRDGPMPIASQWRMQGALGRDGTAHTGGWMAPRDLEHPVDAALVVALTDAWIPAPFVVKREPFAAPTIDLTVHIRASLPLSPQPILGEFSSSLSREGYFEEDGRLWTPDGRLLAQSRQLALAL
jgi:hypothetical protein